MNLPTLLVCDDEPTVGLALRRALEPLGIDVLIDTSSDALHLAQYFQPRAIVLDLLQWRDGLAMLKELKADPQTAHIPVAVVSGLFLEMESPDTACPGAKALGAFAVLPKPLPLSFVDALAEHLLGKAPLPGASEPETVEIALDGLDDALEFELEVEISEAA